MMIPLLCDVREAMAVDHEFIEHLIRAAGRAILEIYSGDFEVDFKDDRSPLTAADRAAHLIITEALEARYPEIPVLSEEGAHGAYTERSRWKHLWLIDPLDGTKEFVNRIGEFCVNIAFVEHGIPRFGAVYLPVPDVLYMGEADRCWKITDDKRVRLTIRPPAPDAPVRVVISRFHPTPELDLLLSGIASSRTVAKGGALKFCAIASGDADLYPRLGHTWEWDTAAGQAIVTAAGGVVVDLNGDRLAYNKPELINGPFMAAASREWLEETGILQLASSLVSSRSSAS